MSNELTISIQKDQFWKYSTFVLLAIVVVGGFTFFNESTVSGGAVAPTAKAGVQGAQQLAAPTAKVEVSADDDPVLGDKNAPVTIIEFSDYECPFCERFWSQTLPSIKKDYIDTGKVKLVFRDFPLSFHPNALPGAVATNCVREKGGDEAYWKMHDLIFKNQATLSVDNLKVWAKSLGYDIGACLDAMKKDEIDKDQADGSAVGVQGTPAFFVNGQLISGAQPFAAFKQAIDAALAEK
ncbi:MAG TPA: DsbA family protein [Candidatus Nanoarchaeia archaeon]|nr:DsbA family protein [Candidatus Nanoarchaeia archaeon]